METPLDGHTVFPSGVTTSPPAGVAAHRRPRHGREWRAYLYIAPAFVVVTAFLLYPLGHAAWISLFEWDGLSPGVWVGFANYIEAFTDDSLLASFEHSAVLVFFFAILPVVLALLLAAIVNRGARMRGIGIFQTLIFLPQIVAAVVIGVIWISIYAPDGLLNTLLRLVGLGELATPWLGDFTTALPAVGLIGTWMELGLCLVLFLTGISQVPTELYDAARVDGAGGIREFFSVTLPALRGSLSVALTLTTIAAVKTFDIVYVSTRGGPGAATTVPAFQVYNLAFREGRVGMATTIGIILTALVLLLTILIRRIAPREDE